MFARDAARSALVLVALAAAAHADFIQVSYVPDCGALGNTAPPSTVATSVTTVYDGCFAQSGFRARVVCGPTPTSDPLVPVWAATNTNCDGPQLGAYTMATIGSAYAMGCHPATATAPTQFWSCARGNYSLNAAPLGSPVMRDYAGNCPIAAGAPVVQNHFFPPGGCAAIPAAGSTPAYGYTLTCNPGGTVVTYNVYASTTCAGVPSYVNVPYSNVGECKLTVQPGVPPPSQPVAGMAPPVQANPTYLLQQLGVTGNVSSVVTCSNGAGAPCLTTTAYAITLYGATDATCANPLTAGALPATAVVPPCGCAGAMVTSQQGVGFSVVPAGVPGAPNPTALAVAAYASTTRDGAVACGAAPATIGGAPNTPTTSTLTLGACTVISVPALSGGVSSYYALARVNGSATGGGGGGASPAPAACVVPAGFPGFTVGVYADAACGTAIAPIAAVPPCGCGTTTAGAVVYGIRADPPAGTTSAPTSTTVALFTSATCASTPVVAVPVTLGVCTPALTGYVKAILTPVAACATPTLSFVAAVYGDATCSLAVTSVPVGPCGCGTGSVLGNAVAVTTTPYGVNNGVPSGANVAVYSGATCTGAPLLGPLAATIGSCTPTTVPGFGPVYILVTSSATSGGGPPTGAVTPSPSAAAVAGAGWTGALQLKVTSTATVDALRAAASTPAFATAIVNAFQQAAGGAAALPAEYVTITGTTAAAASARRRARGLQATALVQVNVGFTIVLPPNVYTAASKATWDARMTYILPASGSVIPPGGLANAVIAAAAAQLGVPAGAILVLMPVQAGYAAGAAPGGGAAAAPAADAAGPVAGGVVGGLAVIAVGFAAAFYCMRGNYRASPASGEAAAAKEAAADGNAITVDGGLPFGGPGERPVESPLAAAASSSRAARAAMSPTRI